MVLFLNRWYKKFVSDLLSGRENNRNVLDKYFNKIPRRVTVSGILNVMTDEEISKFLTPTVSYTYWGEAPNGSSADDLYFHKSKDKDSYVFYGTGRRAIFSFYEGLSMRETFGAYLSCKLAMFNHKAKDRAQYVFVTNPNFIEE